MKYLVTGAGGQLGQALVDCLMQQAAVFTAYQHSELDITDRHEVERVLLRDRPDVVINTAAYTAVDKAESEWPQVYAVNVEGVQHLADLCQQLDILLVQLSTDYVFAGEALAAYQETDATQPLSAYGRSKLLAEQVVAKNSRYLIVRSSWVFSHYGHNFVKTILKAAAERDRLSVVDDQVGSPTSALELAKAILQLADKVIADLALSGCYHYSGATSLSWYEFACRITVIAAQQGVLGKVPSIQPISSDKYPSKAIRPAFSALDCSKIKALGIRTVELDTALEKVIHLLAH